MVSETYAKAYTEVDEILKNKENIDEIIDNKLPVKLKKENFFTKFKSYIKNIFNKSKQN